MIEILHVRDPDYECEVRVFLDGEWITDVAVENVDPGKGYSREDWDLRIQETQGSYGMTPAFKRAVLDALNDYSTNKYII